MRSQITNSMPRLPLKGPKFRLALGRDTAFIAYEDGQALAIKTPARSAGAPQCRAS
jgi:hypothetical protein